MTNDSLIDKLANQWASDVEGQDCREEFVADMNKLIRQHQQASSLKVDDSALWKSHRRVYDTKISCYEFGKIVEAVIAAISKSDISAENYVKYGIGLQGKNMGELSVPNDKEASDAEGVSAPSPANPSEISVVDSEDGFPMGAIINGRVFIERLEDMCRDDNDWLELKRCFNYMGDYLLANHAVPEPVSSEESEPYPFFAWELEVIHKGLQYAMESWRSVSTPEGKALLKAQQHIDSQLPIMKMEKQVAYINNIATIFLSQYEEISPKITAGYKQILSWVSHGK